MCGRAYVCVMKCNFILAFCAPPRFVTLPLLFRFGFRFSFLHSIFAFVWKSSVAIFVPSLTFHSLPSLPKVNASTMSSAEENSNNSPATTPQDSEAAEKANLTDLEKIEEEKLKSKYPGGMRVPGGHSAFLQKRLQKGVSARRCSACCILTHKLRGIFV